MDTLTGLAISNSSLEIANVEGHHQGSFKCAATNAIGGGESDALRIEVHCKLICCTYQRETYLKSHLHVHRCATM